LTSQIHDRDNIIPFPGGGTLHTALRLRVDLLLMPAPVWRRLLVSGDATFWDFHVAIQDAFAWQDRHLHQFVVDDPRDGRRLRLGIPGDSLLDGPESVLPGWEYRVGAYLRPGASTVLYSYDFGDEWQHEVALEEVVNIMSNTGLPRCLSGEGQAPPEDTGGADAVRIEQVLADGPFQPESVVFSNPRRRWHRVFDDD
jgi:hypothetical protein